MRRLRTPAVHRDRLLIPLALIVLAAGAWATSFGVSGQLDALGTALDALQATLQPLADGGDKAAKAQVKSIGKIDKLLAKPATSASYAGEMKAAGKAAKIVAKKLGGEGTLVAALSDAALAYRLDLDVARDDLEALIGTLSGKPQKSAQKKLLKADAKLAAADAALVLDKQLALLAAAAKLLDPVPGAGTAAQGGSPAALAIDSTGSWAFVAEVGDLFGGTADGDVRQMALDANGAVTDLATPALAGVLHPSAIVAHPSAPFVYVGGYGPDGLAQYAIGLDGQLAPLSPPTAAMPGDAPVADLAIDPSGTWLYAMGTVFNGSPLACFRIEADGTLTYTGADYAAPFATATCVAPDGLHAWTATIYEGSLLHPEIRCFRNDGAGNIAWTSGSYGTYDGYLALATSPGGSAVYAARSAPNGDGSIKGYQVGLDGELTLIGTELPAGHNPTAIAITADGKWLYVANQDGFSITQYAILPDDTLAALSPSAVLASHPSALRITPDGKFLLATDFLGTGTAANLVQAFAIGADGKLTAQ